MIHIVIIAAAVVSAVALAVSAAVILIVTNAIDDHQAEQGYQ